MEPSKRRPVGTLCWCVALTHGLTTRQKKQGPAMPSRVCAGLRGAPRSALRGAGVVVSLYRGAGVRRGNVPGVSCPKTASPQMKSMTLRTKWISAFMPPCKAKLCFPCATVVPT